MPQLNSEMTMPKPTAANSSKVSLIPIVAAGVAAFWLWHAHALRGSGAMIDNAYGALIVWFVVSALWGGVITGLALTGRTRAPDFLSLLPGFWLPPLFVFGTAAALMLWPSLRLAFESLATGVSNEQYILVQALRIAAIGGVTKTVLGRLPPAFGFGTGLPDLAFGLSAVILWTTGAWAAFTAEALIAWNMFGAMVFMIAPILLQLTLPGPVQVFPKLPDGRELLDFPMILAPSLLGPLLLIGNALHIVKLVPGVL